MKITEGGFSKVLQQSNRTTSQTSAKTQVGKVYGVVTGQDTPTPAQFQRVGGFNGIGTIFYKIYNESSQNDEGNFTDTFFNGCDTAKPINAEASYPLVDELVILEDLPSSATQESPVVGQKYYTHTIGIWNIPGQNAQPAGNSYRFTTFPDSSDTRNLLRFEGDRIIQGRFGNTIRFGSTVSTNNQNSWSSGPGANGDPIVILSNGHNYDSSSLVHVEDINKDYSSIWFTSTQTIPLTPDRTDVLNPITQPTSVSNYFSSQILMNSNRVIINSKQDEVMIFAKTNVEVNTNNTINLNANDRVHLNAPNISLGTINNALATEPLILGNQMITFLSNFMTQLSSFCSDLTYAKSTAEGSDLVQVQLAAENLNNFLIDSLDPDFLSSLISKQNTTA